MKKYKVLTVKYKVENNSKIFNQGEKLAQKVYLKFSTSNNLF